MLLRGFFDESERVENTEPLSVAGYVFKPQGYKQFVRKWQRMLRSAGPTPTTHFHMTNLYARDKEYAGWSVEQRVEVLRQAVDAVKKHAYCGISVLFSQSEFERCAPPSWRFEHGSIYSGACQMVLRVTAYWMDKHRCHEPIVYAFESGHRFWNEADAILTGTGQHPELRRLYRYHSHSSLHKKKAYGLQAADLLAWVVSRLTVGVPKNQTMNAFAPFIMALAQNQSDRYQLFHPTGDLMRRFFDEQMSSPAPVVVTLKKPKAARLR